MKKRNNSALKFLINEHGLMEKKKSFVIKEHNKSLLPVLILENLRFRAELSWCVSSKNQHPPAPTSATAQAVSQRAAGHDLRGRRTAVGHWGHTVDCRTAQGAVRVGSQMWNF